MSAVTRSSVIDCRKSFSRPAGVEVGASSLTAIARETTADGPNVEISLAAELATGDYLAAITARSSELDLSAADPTLADLVGRRVASGFRGALGGLTATREGRLLRRILWDLPIASMVAGQPSLLDHPLARRDPVMDLAGTDQCSGWRAGGEMMLRIQRMDGRLRMPLGPAVGATAEAPAGPVTQAGGITPRWGPVTQEWGRELAAVDPMASRRARRASVIRGDDVLTALVQFRDSYADPDGIERALHEWNVAVTLDPGSGRIEVIEVDSGQLPWQECPSAGLSAQHLVGRRPEEIEALVASQLRGITTCTHLNDTLRSMAELPDLIDRLPVS